MPALAIPKGAYKRGSNIPALLSNMMFESDPTNTDDGVSLISRTGYDTWATIGTSPIRLMIYERSAPTEGLGPNVYTITESANLYKVSEAGVFTQIGGNGQADFQFAAASRTQLLLTGDEMALSDGSTITPISRAFMDDAEAGMCCAFAGYAIVLRRDSERFHWSAVGDFAAWDALDFASAESLPDSLTHVFSLGDYLYLGGSQGIEIWSASGDADAPFIRTRGRVYGAGISGGLALLENEVAFFVGGAGGAWQISGDIAKISPEWVDEIIARSTIGKAFAQSFDGHTVYVLNGTDAAGAWTLVYDTGSKQWAPWRSHSATGFDPVGGVMLQGRRPILASTVTGKLYEMKKDLFTDDGEPLVREWSALQAVAGKTKVGTLQLDCSTGVGGLETNPQVQMRYSDDRGNTFNSWLDAAIGRIGDFGRKVFWPVRKNCPRDGRLYHFRYAGPTEMTVRKVEINERVR